MNTPRRTLPCCRRGRIADGLTTPWQSCLWCTDDVDDNLLHRWSPHSDFSSFVEIYCPRESILYFWSIYGKQISCLKILTLFLTSQPRTSACRTTVDFFNSTYFILWCFPAFLARMNLCMVKAADFCWRNTCLALYPLKFAWIKQAAWCLYKEKFASDINI